MRHLIIEQIVYLLVSIACCTGAPRMATATPPFLYATEEARLTVTDGGELGGSVAIGGNTAVVGSVFANGQGAAYVFVRNGTTWSQQAKLVSSDIASRDFFGASVAIDGDTIVVGAIYDDVACPSDPEYCNSGATYVFVRTGSTWTQQAKLVPFGNDRNDYFGWSVAVRGDRVIASAPQDSTAPTGQHGSAYMFVRNGTVWTQEGQKLTAADAQDSDYFGSSVAIDSDVVLIGAYADDGSAGANQGSAYVFQRSGGLWLQQAKLTPNAAGPNEYFGNAVGMDGNTAVIAAFGRSGGTGAAYVFTRAGATWTQVQQLSASDAATQDYFGSGVAIGPGIIVIGSYQHGLGEQGSAYVFLQVGNSWQESARLLESQPGDFDHFGRSVAISP